MLSFRAGSAEKATKALLTACANGEPPGKILALLDAGADVNGKDEVCHPHERTPCIITDPSVRFSLQLHWTPLLAASGTGNVELMVLLLERNANANAKDKVRLS